MSARDGLNRVVGALNDHGCSPSPKCGYYAARCPAHDDHDPSLSVQHIEPKGGQAGGRAWVRCYTGCDELQVLAVLGLTLADLYDDPIPTGARRAVHEYPYIGAAGRLVGVVQRREPKTFRPLTIQGAQWREQSSQELQSTPYRLLGVVAAVERNEPIYVVEGERDADTLAALGITATCNAGGAGKWTDAHARWLTGGHVVVCRDRDVPGAKHAEKVLATLAGVAASVRLVEAATGKDVTDHLGAGRTLDELIDVEIPEQTPGPQDKLGRRLRSTPASAVVPRHLRWLWTSRIPLGGLTLLAGREGLGKSTVATDLTSQVTRGVLDGEMYG